LSVSQSDIYAIIHQGTKPEHFQANLEAVRYFQDKQFEFSEAICLQFVRNGVNADQVGRTARILTIPVNRIGNHLNEDSFRKVFFNLLAKGYNDMAYEFLRSVHDRGLAERLIEFHHYDSLLRSFKKANPEPKSFRKVIRFAKKTLSKAEFKQLDANRAISDNPPGMPVVAAAEEATSSSATETETETTTAATAPEATATTVLETTSATAEAGATTAPSTASEPVVAEALATKETEATVTQVVPPTTEAAAQPAAVTAAAENLGEANTAPQAQQQPEAQTNVPPKKEETTPSS
jgi:chemotaxis protein histidine kinase CheA